MKEELAGTTAICVLLKDKKIYCVSKAKRKFFFIITLIFSKVDTGLNFSKN